jgi:hypothetical protein
MTKFPIFISVKTPSLKVEYSCIVPQYSLTFLQQRAVTGIRHTVWLSHRSVQLSRDCTHGLHS